VFFFSDIEALEASFRLLRVMMMMMMISLVSNKSDIALLEGQVALTKTL